MREDRLRWNKKHQQKDNQPTIPSRLLAAYQHLAPPPGRALDLAFNGIISIPFAARSRSYCAFRATRAALSYGSWASRP